MAEKSHLILYPLTSNEDNKEIDYLITGILPRKGLAVLVGASGTGKSQLAIRMASCLAVRERFGEGKKSIGELPIDSCHPVYTGFTVYIAGEGTDNLSNRIASAKMALPENKRKTIEEDFGGRMPIIRVGIRTPLINEGQIPEIEEYILSERTFLPIDCEIRLIVIDTLSACFLIRDENNNSEMQNIVRAMKAYAEHFNCCVLAIAHPPKSGDGPKGFSRGASSLINGADVAIEMKKTNGSNQRIMSMTKMRDGPYEGMRIKLKIDTYGSTAAITPIEDDFKDTSSKEKQKPLNEIHIQILNALRETPDKETSLKELSQILLQQRLESQPGDAKAIAPTSMQRMVRRAVTDLKQLNHIVAHGVGKQSKLKLNLTYRDESNIETDRPTVDDPISMAYSNISQKITPPPIAQT